MGYLFLAQEQLDKAAQGLSLLERLQAGGVPLICLVLAVVLGAFAFWQLRRNNAFQARQLLAAEAREVKAKEDADAREKAAAEAGKTRMVEQEGLLREMLDRDREAQEGQLAMAKALEGYTASHLDNRRMLEEILRRLTDLERRSSP